MKDGKTGNAVNIGILSVMAYLMNYVLRNLLSVSTPNMLLTGEFTKEYLGLLSSVSFITYAVGQLVNGVLGERVDARYMISGGMLLSGVSAILFPLLPGAAAGVLTFGVLGFAMSMLRGPLMKMITENVPVRLARIICTFFNMVGFLGPFVASALIILLDWDMVFIATGVFVICFAIGIFGVITTFQRKGILTVTKGKSATKGSWKGLLRVPHFGFYLIIACLVEIAAASISFWIPTYMTEYLSFAPELSAVLYSTISFLRAMMPFAALFLYERTGGNDLRLIRYFYGVSGILLVVLTFVTHSWVSVVVLALALMAASGTSNMLWTVFIPGLGKTGMTSSANGIFDFTGYAAAAAANLFFANAVSWIGWKGLIFVWAGLMFVGVVCAAVEQYRTAKSAL